MTDTVGVGITVGVGVRTEADVGVGTVAEVRTEGELGTAQVDCGSCALCCKLLGVEELSKPKGKWCPEADRGNAQGCCKIYSTRPLACKMFRCLWLESQESSDPFPAEVKPSKSKVVLTRQMHQAHKAMFALTDPGHPRAFMNEPIKSYLLTASDKGWAVIAGFQADLYSIYLGQFFKLEINKAMLINYGDLALRANGDGHVEIGFPEPLPGHVL